MMLATVPLAFLLNVMILALAIILDLTFGEPPEKFHPTVWMGRVIAFLGPHLRSKSPKKTRVGGVVLCLVCIILFAMPTAILVVLAKRYLGTIGYVVVSAAILKTTFAIKTWDSHITPVAHALRSNRIKDARELCQKTVRRDLSNADAEHIISASVETIAEGIVDGYVSPIFYFAIFATPGAIAYRVINTLDSMVGYKDQTYVDLGRFSAKMDTVANYLPARITGHTLIFVSALLSENWKRAREIFQRDRDTLESINAGWPISAMAGALGIKLEKSGCYAVGETFENLTSDHINRAMAMMRVTYTVLTVVIILPLMYGNQLVQRLMVTM